MRESEFKEIEKRLTKRMAEAKRFQKKVADRIKLLEAQLKAVRSTRKSDNRD
jgi:hypothetical protein